MSDQKPRSGKEISLDQSTVELMEEACNYLELEDGSRAEPIFRNLLKNGIDNAEIRTGLAESLFLQGAMLDGDDEMEHAIRLAETEEEKAQLLALKASLVLMAGYPEAAAIAFMRIDREYPQYTAMYSPTLVQIMMEQGREKEAWRWFEDRLAGLDELSAIEVAFYSKAWFELTIETGRVEFKDKLTRMFKQAAGKVSDVEEREQLISELAISAARITDSMDYRAAEWFVDLALFVDPSFTPMIEAKREMKSFITVQTEIDRMMKDESLFPLVSLHAAEWFFQDDDGELAVEMLDGLPENFVETLYEDKRSFADGIKRLRKKYPATYKMFREDWEELYDELVPKNGNVVHFRGSKS